MNRRDKVLSAIKAVSDVESIQVQSELPLVDGRYLVQLLVYFNNEGQPMPQSLGVHVAEQVATKDTLR